MKKIIHMAVLLVLSQMLLAGTVTQHYSFDRPDISKGQEYARVTYQNCNNFGQEGNPVMPYYNADLLLPQGEEAKNVSIVSVSYYDEIDGITIRPGGKQLPLSVISKTPYQQIRNNNIYQSSDVYPPNSVANLSTNFLSGHGIASFSICPEQYFPSLNKARYIKEIVVQLETTTAKRADKTSSLLQNNAQIDKRITDLVDNADAKVQYTYNDSQKNETYDILLITNSSLLPAFEDYITYKKETGYFVKTITTEDIFSTFDGNDKQEKIRNCIKQYYTENNIAHVLLGGDSAPDDNNQNVIPHRGFYANPGSEDYADTDVPSDMYYACLDGSWNDDNDNKWGEPGEDDLLAEVSIGRICADNAAEIGNHLHKLQKYQNEPVIADIEKSSFIGEKLWDDPYPDGTYAGPYMDELIEGSNAFGYTTSGISTNQTSTKLYDIEGNWSKNDVFNLFNTQGTNLLNHLGHSMTNYNMKMNASDVTTSNFQNDGVTKGYPIGYSQGCYTGAFDNRGTSSGDYSYGDSYAEAITTITTGEAGFISNSRYGWGQQGSTDGASQYLHRQYIDAIFDENITAIGSANQDSKEDNISFINANGTIRWCAYELNLLGDPTMDIWTAVPTEFTANYPQAVQLGCSSIEVETATAGARVAFLQGETLLGRGVADAEGKTIVTLNNPISDPTPITISIIGHNKIQKTDNIIVASEEAYVIYNEMTLSDNGNNNGSADFGEEITLDITIKNVGNNPAAIITGTISTDDEYVTITNAEQVFGTLAAGETSVTPTAFKCSIATNIPDQHDVTFTLTSAEDSKATWVSTFNIKLNAPKFTLQEMVINDEEGDNNGMFNPDEHVTISFPVLNSGHTASPEASCTLSCNNDKITITESDINLGIINAEQTATATFNLHADPDIPTGTSITLTYHVTAADYTAERIYNTVLGVTDDFESGDFASQNWTFGGNAEWQIDNNFCYSGTNSAKSGSIGNNSSTSIKLNYSIPDEGQISFSRRVSSENSYDFLTFKINGVEKDNWSGELPWDLFEYVIPAGDYLFEWVYAKDTMEESGSDCAWIDYIIISYTDHSAIESGSELPTTTTLYQNYPNPFNPATKIKFYNAATADINLSIFNVKGEMVANLIHQKMEKGMHAINFNAARFNSGAYYYVLKTANKRIVKKMLLIK